MAIQTRFSSFDLHQTGLSASDKAKAAVEFSRGDAASGAAIFTDNNRNFTTESITTSHKIEILGGTGNIARDVLITAVGTTTVTVAGGNFDATANNLQYRVYLPPTSTQIIDDPSKRGIGLVGWQEMLDLIEAVMTGSFLSGVVDVTYSEGLIQQVVTYDDA